MRRGGWSPAAAALAVALGLAWAGPARADLWYEHYARAESALAASDWPQAVEELNEALRRKGDSGARERTYGMHVVAYFPYLKLGIAYAELGQYEAALQAFDTEERLGAVRTAAAAWAELQRYRAKARAGVEKAEAGASQHVAAIVREAVAEAARLEAGGRLEEAMTAVGRALAVSPADPEATALLARLREAAGARERARQDADRAAVLLERGRQALAEGRFAAAASQLRQSAALAVGGGEAEALLRRAEAGLRQVREAGASEAGAATPNDGARLAEARALGDAGRFDEALERLQPLLAAAPDQGEAAALSRRLLEEARHTREREAAAGYVRQAEAELAAGRPEGALAAANRALALDSGDSEALAVVQRAYGAISRTLLGLGVAGRLPPAIRFVDAREAQPDGSRVQVVRDPDLRVAGMVIDRSPVEVRFADDRGRALAAETHVQEVGELVLTEFTLRRRLEPGATRITVYAADPEGLSSAAEYDVHYARPLQRTPWFVAVLVVLPLGGGVVVLAARARRRRALRRRKFNPYVAGAPVLDERLFFGREPLIQRVLQRVHSNSLLLHGERRIGKTSLLHQLKRRLADLDDPEVEFFPVFVDLQGVPEERFFETLGCDLAEELSEVLPPGTVAAGAPSSGERAYGYRELVADLRGAIAALGARTRKRVRVVLLVDEVDELNDYDPRTNQRLRSLFMRAFAENLAAVVSGVEIRRRWDQQGSPWYNFFEEIEVTSIAREDAACLVREPLRGMFVVEDGAVEAILDRTGCRPYQIQRLCVALVDRLHQEGRTAITVADVDAAVQGLEP